MAKMIREEFSVTGSFRFPFDMLRYDQCFPASEQDSAQIQRTIYDGENGPVTVRVARLATRGAAPINIARWQSFGWHVDQASFEQHAVAA